MNKLAGFAVSVAVLTMAFTESTEAGTNPYIGDIVMVGENYCPRGWAETDGRLMPISQYNALFSLLGSTYGGDGRTTFALPDLRSRVVIGMGQGAGLSPIQQGQTGGVEMVTITQSNMPNHTHTATTTATTVLNASNESATEQSPEDGILAEASGNTYGSTTVDATLRNDAAATTVSTTIAPTGGGQPVSIVQPFIGMKFCIAIEGAYPSRS